MTDMTTDPADGGALAVEPTLADDPALGLDRRAKLEILGAVMLALFLGALDQTIVGTALPRIVTDLGGNDLYTWVVTIYLLTSTITVPFYGKLSDIYGRKRLLMFGITVFLIGSALSGLSQTMGQLILFRGIQGIGAGALFPISLAIIGDLFSPAERGKYQGLFGAVFGISFLLGPAIGGLITDHVSWHWVFFVNIPIGLVSLFVISRLLPNIRHGGRARELDYVGGVVFAVGIGLLLVGLTNKQSGEWTDIGVGGFVGISAVLTAIFLAIESRAKQPIVPLDLWRHRTYSASMVATFLASFGFFGAVIFLPRWFQVVDGESATASGYLMFPLLAGLIGSSIVSGQIVARTGRYKPVLLAAFAIMAVGVALMTQLDADTDIAVLWSWMFVTGVGIGPTMAVFTIAVQNAVPFSKLGVATSNLTFFRQIGGSIGLAIAGTIFATALRNELPVQLQPVIHDIVATLSPQQQEQAGQLLASFGVGSQAIDPNKLTGVGQSFGGYVLGSLPADLRSAFEAFVPQLDHAFHEAFSRGIAATFVAATVIVLLALGVTLAMKEEPLRRTSGAGRSSRAPVAGGEAVLPAVDGHASSDDRDTQRGQPTDVAAGDRKWP